jgi:hypothetical protein
MLAIGTESDAGRFISMSLKTADHLTGLDIPQDEGFVV